MQTSLACALFAVVFALQAWTPPEGPAVASSPEASQPGNAAIDEENDPRWHEDVLALARHYRSWKRLDDASRFAPTLCDRPAVPAHYSQARGKAAHASKLYTLYAKDPAAYGATPTADLWKRDTEAFTRFEHLRQVIVKEAWKADSMGADAQDVDVQNSKSWGRSGLRPAKRDGHWWRGDEPAGLFMMFQPEETELPTDAGWVYATVEPDGKTISGAGKIASCIECHARHEDRLFGLPDDRADDDENDERWHDKVLALAMHYQRWQRLDDATRFAPTLCRMPPAPPGRHSEARGKIAHARKLYTLYAKDPEAYGAPPSAPRYEDDAEVLAQFEDLQQVIVKEAWKPVSLGKDDDDPRLEDWKSWGPARLRPTKKHGQWWKAGDPAGLFLMFKPRQTDLPTDAGWVYATVSADGEKVTGAGRMASCIRCHAEQADRQFGLPESSAERGGR